MNAQLTARVRISDIVPQVDCGRYAVKRVIGDTVDVRATKVIVFSISAAYAGIAGGMFTTYQSFMNPENFGFAQIVLVLSMIVVGGLGTLPGTLIGVLLLGILPEIMRTVKWALVAGD